MTVLAEQGPDIIIISGSPYAGASSVCEEMVGRYEHDQVRHVEINAQIGNPLTVARESIEDMLWTNPDGLILFDGFPVGAKDIHDFKQLVQTTGSKVLAICLLSADDMAAVNRSADDLSVTHDRRHNDQEARTTIVDALEDDHVAPIKFLDGLLPVEVNADHLQEIYKAAYYGHVPIAE